VLSLLPEHREGNGALRRTAWQWGSFR
jgi:hypothetical protein